MESNNFGIPAPLDGEYKDVAWGITKKGEKFQPMWIPRHNPNAHDVKMEVLYCGICHSDCTIGDDLIG